ncbi:hypothetical protein D3Z62_12450 [Lachnospiraceae bacterium]|nr:hypothetical protein [Lachnospiraceae bacterium]
MFIVLLPALNGLYNGGLESILQFGVIPFEFAEKMGNRSTLAEAISFEIRSLTVISQTEHREQNGQKMCKEKSCINLIALNSCKELLNCVYCFL